LVFEKLSLKDYSKIVISKPNVVRTKNKKPGKWLFAGFGWVFAGTYLLFAFAGSVHFFI